MNVLFVCTANGGRSVMAEQLLLRESGGRHAARSAGSMPGAAAHPQVVEALAEMGIDASDHVPRKLDDEAIAWADVVVATCDDACPVVPGKRYVAWQIPDPKNEPIERVREIRDEIAAMEVMAVNPIGRLVTPRLMAASTVALFLVSLVSVAGLAGGYVFNVLVQHVTAGAYFSGFTQLVQLPDLWQSLAKAWVFGFIAAMVSCYKGLYCKGGPKGVGDAVNQGVVITFIFIFFVNFVMTTLYFALVPQKF